MFRALILGLVGLLLLAGPVSAEEPTRDPRWAHALQLEGVINCYRISEHLYRSAQPSDKGFAKLKELGVKTIIDLRAFHNDRTAAAKAGLFDEELALNAWHCEDEDVIKVMKILAKPEGGPYLIHCEHGSDRTGLMIAMYRILFEKWTKEQAIDEMTHGGYGFHPVWSNIINYVRAVDVEAMKTKIGEVPNR